MAHSDNQLTAEELAAIRETYEEFGAHEYPVGRLLATVEAALLSIEDQAAIIADRDATVEALRAENRRMRGEIRAAFAAYQESEGCECCQSNDHTIHAKTMARLMKEPEA